MENINLLGVEGVAFLVIMCLLVGLIVKNTGLDNKWIPTICGVFGAAMSAFAFACGVDVHASNYFEAVAIGIVSGLGSVGCHQLVKQLTTAAAVDADVDYKAGYFNILDEYKRYRDEHEPEPEYDEETKQAVAEVVNEEMEG